LRTQQILAFETGVPSTIDPLAGSYFVESLTDELERQAEDVFAEIDELGGVVAGIESGYFQARIAHSARRFQDELEAGRRVIVGVNSFCEDGEREIDILRIDESAAEKQGRRLAELRARRDPAAVDRTLAALTAAAEGDDNLMTPMLDAVRAYATLGEIRGALESVYGRFQEPVGF
jgi:methylmalonyl-CoA mutase N-terminal domain/subunit